MEELVARVQAFPFAKEFSNQLAKIKQCAQHAQDRSWVVHQFPQESEQLSEAKDDLDKMAAFANGSSMSKIWQELKEFLDSKAHYLDSLGIDTSSVADIKDVVEDKECYKSGKIPNANKEMTGLVQQLEERIEELRNKASDSLDSYRKSSEMSSAFSEVDQDARDELGSIFENAKERLAQATDPYRIRNFVDTFKQENKDRLGSLIVPKAPNSHEKEPQGAPTEIVSLSALPVEFNQPFLNSHEDAEAYISALRDAIYKALDDGKNIMM